MVSDHLLTNRPPKAWLSFSLGYGVVILQSFDGQFTKHFGGHLVVNVIKPIFCDIEAYRRFKAF
jgi:hypothetical protein